jgi:hypothetical protein
VENGQTKVVAQKTVVIEADDAVYLLQVNSGRPMLECRTVGAHRFLAVTSRYSHPITPSRRYCSASSTSWASSVAAST